ncbi:uncharacterized protein LOC112600446 [Melanaphis sacchari]|uniref:E3 SUMO-protein ligase PIAS4 n=1 Tax=Melanaphis sacchari TaxID=742174 RepID=A0A2H8TXJ9_9HEMI|nr:uncharacterized protein LOC112600446 [Melanaphis sacchari]
MDQSSETPQCNCLAAENCILDGNYEFYRYGDREITEERIVKFKVIPFRRILNTIVPPMYIHYPPGVQTVGPINVCCHFGSEFYLSLSDVQKINLSNRVSNDRKKPCQLLIRIGEQQPGTIELLDVVPTSINMWINSKQLPTDDMKNPLYVDPIDYLNLNTVNPNRFTVYCPEYKKPFIIIIYLVEEIGVKEVVEYFKTDKNQLIPVLKTKKLMMESVKDSMNGSNFALYTVNLLCPINNLRMKLPAKSENCNHVECFDLQTFISLNYIKPTWICPICKEPCPLDSLKLDSYLLSLINSQNIPNHDVEMQPIANGKRKLGLPSSDSLEDVQTTSCGLTKKSILEIDSINMDNENLGDVKPVLPIPSSGNSKRCKTEELIYEDH